MKPLLEITNLHYSPTGSDNLILKKINLTVERGKIIGIAGESGSGKTTLAKLIAGILKPTDGTIQLDTGKVQLLFQNTEFIINPYRRVDKMIEEAVKLENKKADIELEKQYVFNQVNFNKNLWAKKGMQLSGGERQKAALARLLAVKPELLILDEPFSAQDIEAQTELAELIKKLNKEDCTIICVAHDLKILQKFCDELIIMYKGEIVESGVTQKVINNPRNRYTQFLIKAGSLKLCTEDFLNIMN
ncbi:MAG: ATP-binding cassette domain-containing protein [Ignavibacteriaceae bacterium]|nr:ATP-binding cassette domain-containing protein [Ignavibacteriaceae bacterium]